LAVEKLEVKNTDIPAQELSDAIDKIEEPGNAKNPAIYVEEELK